MHVIAGAALVHVAAADSAAVSVECLALHELLAALFALTAFVNRACVLLFALSASSAARCGGWLGKSDHFTSP